MGVSSTTLLLTAANERILLAGTSATHLSYIAPEQPSVPDRVTLKLNAADGTDTGKLLTAAGNGLYLCGYTAASVQLGGFHQGVVAPEKISRASTSTRTYRNQIMRTSDGQEFCMIRHAKPSHSLKLTTGVENQTTLYEIMQFFRNRRGGLNGFTVKDPTDHSTSHTHRGNVSATDYRHRHVLGAGDGTNDTFYLCKRYRGGKTDWNDGHTVERIRAITRPDLRSFANNPYYVWVDNVLQTEGVDYALFPFGGLLLFDPSSIPGAGKVVEWAGEYFLPVRFSAIADAGLMADLENETHYTLSDFDCEELLEETEFSDHKWLGGVQQHVMLSDQDAVAIALDAGRFHRITNPGAATANVFLPDTDGMGSGGPILHVVNDDASAGSLNLVQTTVSPYTTVATIAPGVFRSLFILQDGTWHDLSS